MKKSVLFFLVAFGASTMLYSCKKCSTCEYKYDMGGTASTFTYPEQCGKKKDIEAYEAACKTAATAASGTCTCTSK